MTTIGGIDVDALTPTDGHAFPDSIVQGRVLQLDGDVLIYQCGYDDTKSLRSCINRYFEAVEFRRKMTGSSHVNIHMTYGDKGGRYNTATVKEYQGTRRKNREKVIPPVNLKPLKDHICTVALPTETYTVWVHEHQEADDGMAQGNFAAIKEGCPELSVIMSIDKDLCMCSGWHCDWDSFEMTLVDGYGSIHLDRSTSTVKVKGFGTSFFWAQLLMGDTADDIPGLPKLGGDLLHSVDPTKKVTADLEILATHNWDSIKYKAAKKRLAGRKPKSCGAVMAYNILKDCRDDRAAMQLVVEAYISCYENKDFRGRSYPHKYDSWQGMPIERQPVEMLLEQAELLWMRRVEDESPKAFFKDVQEGLLWTKEKA
jgi:hypothetical protein